VLPVVYRVCVVVDDDDDDHDDDDDLTRGITVSLYLPASAPARVSPGKCVITHVM